ncbi:MAG: hypothetical protein R3F60_12300 [bacterium]
MNRRVASGFVLLGALALAACKAPGPEAASGPADPVADVQLWLAEQVFADPADMIMRFAPGLDPREFPPRLMVDAPEQYRFVDLWRVRMVDGRLLVDALMTFSGQPHVVSFHLEQVDEAWRVASWSPAPVAVEGQGRAPPAGLDLPATLAAATFRGAPPARVVPIAPSSEAAEEEDRRVAVRVGFQAFTFEGECPQARLTAALRRATRRLGSCHADAFGSTPRAGRLTFALEFDASGNALAVLRETTLLAGALTDCVGEALHAVVTDSGRRRSPISHCTVSVPITFSPRKQASP